MPANTPDESDVEPIITRVRHDVVAQVFYDLATGVSNQWGFRSHITYGQTA
ncbi:hypothetical protein SAMN05216277_1299 [Halolamina pelagica]|uniref:Uncharacterized protein n=1 Tax=Halolamina pelagica TaxID=699431 RepID=A0A1I5WF54_9EURY|nr:hypothetical protein SAMN05216277_1299 [Halolamina pelagica]